MSVRFESSAEPITGYRLIERLGSGGFGEVWKAEAPGGIFKAIKIIHGDLRNRENDTYRFAEQELKALKRVKQVRHPYLLALDRYDIVEGRLMITMELADCNLWDRFRQCRKQGHQGIPREELLRYMSETAEVLDLFNDKFQLQHLDIKPQNLFLLYDHVKVADFGQVKDLEGLMAQVTGGITPVYAAPETFDGFVSRFCDQYSLACVYQELLTGQRPFDGTSMQQLLMQHLQMPPNLQPSPYADRPALQRALSKKPDDRYPNVMSFVNAIRAGETAQRVSVPVPVPPAAAPSAGSLYSPPPVGNAEGSDQIRVSWMSTAPKSGTNEAGSVTSTGYGYQQGGAISDKTPLRNRVFESVVPIERPAPPEVTGSGSLRPALIVGIGYTGLRVLQRIKKSIQDRFYSPTAVPAVRLLYIDTDPETQTLANADAPWDGLAGLSNDSIFPARLNRASHYLKPQVNGRAPLEDWFDLQLLYRLPRIPSTVGLRPLGRLAFADHYRNLHQKFATDLELCLNPQALTDSQVNTGLEIATNRPRVYVIASLAGGTGSGMFLDVAYALRYRLKRLGYTDPDVVGMLTVPPEGSAAELAAHAQANTYAALTELHHYSREDTSYTVNFDERIGGLRDDSKPFSEVYLQVGLPCQWVGITGNGQPANATRSSGSHSGTTRNTPGSGVRGYPTRRSSGTVQSGHGQLKNQKSGLMEFSVDDSISSIADVIRTELFTKLGPIVRAARQEKPLKEQGTEVRTFGVKKFTWPRAVVVERVARIVAPVLISQWFSPDSLHSRTVVPAWIQDQWTQLPLEPELLAKFLLEKAIQKLGYNPINSATDLVASINPKGWLQRLPDPEQVSVILAKCQEMLGRPNPPAHVEASHLDEALLQAVLDHRPIQQSEIAELFTDLVENPQFRLAGAEEAIRQMHSLIDRTRIKLEKKISDLSTQCTTAYEMLLFHAMGSKSTRKTTAADFSEALKTYPATQVQVLLSQAVVKCLLPLRDQLACQLLEVGGCRQRIESAHPALLAEADLPAVTAMPGELLPAGCTTPEDAAQMFVKCLNDDDLQQLDKFVQVGLEETFGGLYEAGLNAGSGFEKLHQVIREKSKQYLDERLGEVDLAGMLAQRYPTRDRAIRGLERYFEEAKPRLVGGGPWSQQAIEIFATPPGDGGAPIQELVTNLLSPEVIVSDIPDEIFIHREYPQVPLSAIPHLGPSWSAAYRTAPDGLQIPPHSRYDVTDWTDVDSN
jgi:eukaryotic-like serine/threonine-protein kinase